MKKTRFLIVCLLFVLSGAMLFAQNVLYNVTCNGDQVACTDFFNLIDTCYPRFNKIFHFDEKGPGYKYPVTLFTNKADYRAYVAEATGAAEPKSETVFLRYSDVSKSEIVAVVAEENRNTFIRQLFTQYIYSFLGDAPAWLTNGFALYFEEYAEGEETPWLEAGKSLYLDANKRIPVRLLLEATKDTYTSEIFLPQTWLFVSFLLDTPYARNSRFLYDNVLQTYSFPYNNENHFINYYNKWIDDAQFEKDYEEYVLSLHSTKEYLAKGIKLYGEKNITDAKVQFNAVLEKQPTNYTASYYLALCNYTEKNYTQADVWYRQALRDGADPALVNWGLGASAIADKRFDEAKTYLFKAKQLDEATYGKKVDDLIQQIP